MAYRSHVSTAGHRAEGDNFIRITDNSFRRLLVKVGLPNRLKRLQGRFDV